ncbi:MAG: hypothetical protein ABFD16_26945 [Thermoguttaceae bacterium]
MAPEFDPYYTWLGIRPEEQPPHHYRLLGLQLFEDNVDAIEHAADRQMAHLRTLQTGKHAEASQQLLNEVATAKVCLLNAQKKAAYDATLRERLSSQVAAVPVAEPLVDPSLAALLEGVKAEPLSAKTPARLGRRQTPTTTYLLLAAVAVAVVILGMLLWPRPAVQTPSPTTAPQQPEVPTPQPAEPKPSEVAASPSEPSTPVPVMADEPPPPANAASSPGASPPPTPTLSGEHLPLGQWVDVLKYADLEWGRAYGDWSRQAEGIVGALSMKDSANPRLALPVEIDGSYDLEVELTRNERDLTAGVILPVGRRRVALRFDCRNFGTPISGLEPINGQSAMRNPTARTGAAFVTGQRALVAIQVRVDARRASISTQIDGKPFLQWEGPLEMLNRSPQRQWSLPGENPLGLSCNFCKVTFHSVRVRMVSGQAVITKAPSQNLPIVDAKPAEPAPAKPEPKPEKRLSVPTSAEQEKTLVQLEEVYKLKQNRPAAQKVALAQTLLDLSEQASPRPVEQFVLLHTAMEQARDGGDADVMLQAVEAIVARFDVEALNARAKALAQFAKNAPEGSSLKGFAAAADRTIEQALADNRYELAMELAEEAYRLGQKPQGKAFRKQTYDRRNEVKRLYDRRREIEQTLVSLKASPEDPALNLAAGRWHCLELGDWRQGLPCLAKGSDEKLKALAQQELTSPPLEPADQVKLADAWFDLAQTMSGKSKDEVLLHAGAWYRQVEMSGITGLLATKVSKQLKDIGRLGRPIPDLPSGEPQPGEELPAGVWVNVFKWVDVERDRAVGQWKRNAEEIVAGYAPWTLAEGHPRLALPVAVEGGYDLRVEFTRTGPPFMVGAILPAGARQLVMAFDQGPADDKASGLELIEGKGFRDNPTTKRGPAVLTNGLRYTVLHRVRLEGDRVRIEILLNGQVLLQWTGRQALLMTTMRPYALPGKNWPGLVASNSEVIFHTAWLRRISGKATRVDVAGKMPQ